MLQNAYLLAKIGADTAENERNFAQNLPKLATTVRPRPPRWRRWRRRPPGPPARPRRPSQPGLGGRVKKLGLAKLGKLAKFCKFWRARSRLYQNEILQENMRLAAFFKLYKICILLHRCHLKIFAKNQFEKSDSAIFVKMQQQFCKFRKICKISKNSAR